MTARPRARTLRATALAAAVAALAGSAVYLTDALPGVEAATVHARFAARGASTPGDVVIVGIDDRTFGDLNRQWPFPRSLHGRVVDALHAAGAREIVYDVQFTEPTAPREDRALYDAIARAGGAVLATSESDASGHTNVLGGDASLAAARARAGAADLTSEQNGSITRFPHDVALLPSLAAVAAARAKGRPVPLAQFGDGGALIDYRGGPGTITSLPFSSVLRGRFDPSAIRGKIVVIGATAPTLQDMHATPTGSEPMSGPEVQANAIWTALHGFPLRDAPAGLDLLLVLVLAALPLAARLAFKVLATVLAAVLAAVAYIAAAQVAFDTGTVLAVFAPLGALTVSTVGMIVASHSSETRERRRVARENDALDARVRERTRALEASQIEVVRRLAVAVESRDAETGQHIDRIGKLCQQLALAIGLDTATAVRMRHAAALHDVGKIAIPDHVLLKPGTLDRAEWDLMRTHTIEGARILAGSESELVQLGQSIALTHHEHWDGSGYPSGLAGEEIPLAGRICAVCDAYDAMTSSRPYKAAISPEAALAEIASQAGAHFDPRLADAFCRLRRDLVADTTRPSAVGLAYAS